MNEVGNQHWTREQVRQAETLQRKGLTLREISVIIGQSYEAVTLYLYGGVVPTILDRAESPVTEKVETECAPYRPAAFARADGNGLRTKGNATLAQPGVGSRESGSLAAAAHRMDATGAGTTQCGDGAPPAPSLTQPAKAGVHAPRLRARPKVVPSPAPPPERLVPFTQPKPNPDADLVAGFIARHGVRRFETALSADTFHLRQMLAARGIEVVFKPTGVSCTWKEGRGRPRTLTRAEFYDRVDALRRAEGLEPMVRRP